MAVILSDGKTTFGINVPVQTKHEPQNRVAPEEEFNIFQDKRVRSALYQILVAAVFGWLLWYLVSNTAHNLEARGMNAGFGFLNNSAGFDTAFKLIDYVPGIGTYGQIFIIGVLNTLLVSFLAIILSTILGFFIGVLRLSNNWLVSNLALFYVEVFRNVPLLVQVIFWYTGVFSLLPSVKATLDLSLGAQLLQLNNRGLYIAPPIFGDAAWLTFLGVAVAIFGVIFLRIRAGNMREKSGIQSKAYLVIFDAILLAARCCFYLNRDAPKLGRTNASRV